MSSNVDYLTRLPWEIKELISAHLKHIDVLCLMTVDGNFQGMLKNKRRKAIDFSCDFRLDSKIARDIHASVCLANITHINFNGAYWIKAEEIRKVLRRLPSLETAYLMGTQLYYDVDIKFLTGLTKWDNLVVGLSRNRVREPVKFFSISTDRRYAIDSPELTENGEKIAVTEMKPENRSPRINYIIYDSDWMNEAVHILLSRSRTSAIKQLGELKERVEIDFNKCYDPTLLETASKQHPNAKELVIRSNKKSVIKISKINLNLICSFKYLQRLRLEINSGSNNFLDNVFGECKQLKFLRIVSHVPQFKITRFRNARCLEDLSLELNGSFQLEKFLMELGDNENLKLKRIYLKFWHFNKLQLKLLQDFLHRNCQLVVFVIVAEMSESLANSINKIFKLHCKSQQQRFKFVKFDRLISAPFYIEPVHYDLLDACCSFQ